MQIRSITLNQACVRYASVDQSESALQREHTMLLNEFISFFRTDEGRKVKQQIVSEFGRIMSEVRANNAIARAAVVVPVKPTRPAESPNVTHVAVVDSDRKVIEKRATPAAERKAPPTLKADRPAQMRPAVWNEIVFMAERPVTTDEHGKPASGPGVAKAMITVWSTGFFKQRGYWCDENGALNEQGAYFEVVTNKASKARTPKLNKDQKLRAEVDTFFAADAASRVKLSRAAWNVMSPEEVRKASRLMFAK